MRKQGVFFAQALSTVLDTGIRPLIRTVDPAYLVGRLFEGMN